MFDPDGRLGVRLREAERRCIRALGGRTERDLEYQFADRHIVGHSLRILDVGGVGSVLPLVLARRGHRVTVCDVRAYPETHGNLIVVQSDFLEHDFGEGDFDVVVLISTIEHVGFGCYGDPTAPDGDMIAMHKVWRVLRGGGRVILTTPFIGSHRIFNGSERWYDMARMSQLLKGFRIETQDFWLPKLWLKGRCLNWVPAGLGEAERAEAIYGYHATVCLVCRKEGGECFVRTKIDALAVGGHLIPKDG